MCYPVAQLLLTAVKSQVLFLPRQRATMATEWMLWFKAKDTWPQTLKPKRLLPWPGGLLVWFHEDPLSLCIFLSTAWESLLSSQVPLALWHRSRGHHQFYPIPSMTKHLSLCLPGSSSSFLFLTLNQNSIRHYLLYVGTSSKIVTVHLLLLMGGGGKGEMRFLNEATMGTGWRVVARVHLMIWDSWDPHNQINSACYS